MGMAHCSCFHRGWGLRSLDDIPKGTFVCTYIGHVYSEEVGNELGTRDGDEYQAELDYIGEFMCCRGNIERSTRF